MPLGLIVPGTDEGAGTVRSATLVDAARIDWGSAVALLGGQISVLLG
jgi:hypothetical protein